MYKSLLFSIVCVIYNITVLAQPVHSPHRLDNDSLISPTMPDCDSWWREFNDPCIDTLIHLAVANNYDLSIAARKILIAKNNVAIGQSAYYPKFDLALGYTKSKTSAAINPLVSSLNNHYFSANMSVSWEIDVFGRVYTQTKGNKALYEASKYDYYYTMISLCSGVISSYISLCTYQQEYSVAKSHINSQRQILEMTEARYKSGMASMLDVSQAKSVYYSTLSTLPLLEYGIDEQINIIATYLGIYPVEVKGLIKCDNVMPDFRIMVNSGVSENVIRRRPDVIAAEYTISSYMAAYSISKKEYLPQLLFTGSVGYSAGNIGDIFTKNGFNYSFMPTLTWNVFDGLQRKYNIKLSQEQLQNAIDTYNQTILNAYQEISLAASSYKYNIKQVAALKIVANENKRTLELSIDLYKRGLSAFTNVENAQLSLLEAQNALVEAEGNALQSVILLYKALAGGWISK